MVCSKTVETEVTTIIERTLTLHIHPQISTMFMNGDEDEDRTRIEFENVTEKILNCNKEILWGKLHIEYNSFTFQYNTLNDSYHIKQVGEYNMYGGPYIPKMKKPTITSNGVDITDFYLTEVCKIPLPWKCPEGRNLGPESNQYDLLVNLLSEGSLKSIQY
jgi:hypothetical protein